MPPRAFSFGRVLSRAGKGPMSTISSITNAEVGVQYRVGGHTFTLVRQVQISEQVRYSDFAEIDGRSPAHCDVIPATLGRFFCENIGQAERVA